jgi:pyruvate/2-oxoglutarate dehydrogenase complex dihydrolipoamide dehydrogenase (E3) component
VLAERGHDVMLMDAGLELGGQLLTVQKASGREEWQDVNRYYGRELERLKVHTRLDTTVDAALVGELAPDTVIIATGSVPRTEPWDHLPPIDGGDVALNVRDVLEQRVETGDRVVVYAGDNHIQGLTTADTLLDRDKDVTVIIPQEAPGKLAEAQTTWALMTRLGAKGVSDIKMLSAITEFDGGNVSGVNLLTGQSFDIPCDSLVSSFGGIADDRLYFQLKDTSANVLRIGDCVAPRSADTAIYDGAKVGRRL